jgi:hypothetical protein
MRELLLDGPVVQQLLDDDEFFRRVPEFHYLKETSRSLRETKEGCGPCQESRDAAKRHVLQTLARHVALLYRDYGVEGLARLKAYIQVRSPKTETCVLYYRDVPDEALKSLRF